MKEHIRQKRSMTHGRIFFTRKDMAVAKHDEDVANAYAKREGKPIVGVHQYHCGCGGEGCWITLGQKNTNAILTKKDKKPTKHPKRKESPMFSGKII